MRVWFQPVILAVLSVTNVECGFTKSPSSCTNDVPLLILIHTAPSNVELRKSLRKTWTRNDPNFKTVFVIGHSSSDAFVMEEADAHNDILVTIQSILLPTCNK